MDLGILNGKNGLTCIQNLNYKDDIFQKLIKPTLIYVFQLLVLVNIQIMQN